MAPCHGLGSLMEHKEIIGKKKEKDKQLSYSIHVFLDWLRVSPTPCSTSVLHLRAFLLDGHHLLETVSQNEFLSLKQSLSGLL